MLTRWDGTDLVTPSGQLWTAEMIRQKYPGIDDGRWVVHVVGGVLLEVEALGLHAVNLGVDTESADLLGAVNARREAVKAEQTAQATKAQAEAEEMLDLQRRQVSAAETQLIMDMAKQEK